MTVSPVSSCFNILDMLILEHVCYSLAFWATTFFITGVSRLNIVASKPKSLPASLQSTELRALTGSMLSCKQHLFCSVMNLSRTFHPPIFQLPSLLKHADLSEIGRQERKKQQCNQACKRLSCANHDLMSSKQSLSNSLHSVPHGRKHSFPEYKSSIWSKPSASLFMLDIIKIDQELCKQKYLDTMKLLNQHFSSKTWTNLRFSRLPSVASGSSSSAGGQRKVAGVPRSEATTSKPMRFEGSHRCISEQITKYLFQPQNRQPKVCQIRRQVVAIWISQNGAWMSVHTIMVQNCLHGFVYCTVFQSPPWECSILKGSAQSVFKVLTLSSHRQHFGKSSATTKTGLRKLRTHNTKCMVCLLWWHVWYMGMSVLETILCHQSLYCIFFLCAWHDLKSKVVSLIGTESPHALFRAACFKLVEMDEILRIDAINPHTTRG